MFDKAQRQNAASCTWMKEMSSDHLIWISVVFLMRYQYLQTGILSANWNIILSFFSCHWSRRPWSRKDSLASTSGVQVSLRISSLSSFFKKHNSCHLLIVFTIPSTLLHSLKPWAYAFETPWSNEIYIYIYLFKYGLSRKIYLQIPHASIATVLREWKWHSWISTPSKIINRQ